MPYYTIKPSYTANCKRFIHSGRDFPFNVIISAPARDIVNNTIIGTSISTGLAISPGRKPFRKTQKRTNSPKVQQFGVFPTHLDRRLLLSFANFRCTVGHRPIAELLIEAGAEVNVQKNNKWGETPLHYATWAGHKDVAGLLIARGANVNARDNEQSTPLHFAANRGHKDVLELLMVKGADVNAKDRKGRTPLWYAQEESHTELVDLLRKHGAKE